MFFSGKMMSPSSGLHMVKFLSTKNFNPDEHPEFMKDLDHFMKETSQSSQELKTFKQDIYTKYPHEKAELYILFLDQKILKEAEMRALIDATFTPMEFAEIFFTFHRLSKSRRKTLVFHKKLVKKYGQAVTDACFWKILRITIHMVKDKKTPPFL
jgi:hypothetical protein